MHLLLITKYWYRCLNASTFDRFSNRISEMQQLLMKWELGEEASPDTLFTCVPITPISFYWIPDWKCDSIWCHSIGSNSTTSIISEAVDFLRVNQDSRSFWMRPNEGTWQVYLEERNVTVHFRIHQLLISQVLAIIVPGRDFSNIKFPSKPLTRFQEVLNKWKEWVKN